MERLLTFFCLINIFIDDKTLATKIAQILKDVMRESAVVKSLEAARRMELQKASLFSLSQMNCGNPDFLF